MKRIFLLLFLCSTFISAQEIPMYVGTYTNGESEGIYSYKFNTKTGELSHKKLAVEAVNPSFITISNDKKFIYAVSESGKESVVISYSLNSDGTLSFLNKVSSNGASPCHIQLNENNSKLVVSNYGGGTISLYDITKDHSIKNAFQILDHNTKELKSHAHAAKFLNNELFVADLGRNFLAHYNLKNTNYNLQEQYSMKTGAGPRHFEIANKGEFIYVINELNSTISVLKKGGNSYSNIQNISTLRDNYQGNNSCADIHLSKNGKFLYGSNRGENSIVVYAINENSGKLTKIQNISVEGDWPRNFTLSPNGKFLLVANKKSNNISCYEINSKTGTLKFMYSTKIAAPVCLIF